MEIRVNKVVRVAAGEDAAAWRDARRAPGWADGATVLKEDRGSWVRRANLLGRDVVVKCRELNTFGRRFKHAIGMGHGAKHWRGAELLTAGKVRTAAPFVLMQAKVDGRSAELLVMEYLDGPTLLECMRDVRDGKLPVRQQHVIAAAAGRQMSRMGWIFNRDHKPSNLIVLGVGTPMPELAVIDCVAVMRRQVPKMARMHASLVIEPAGCGVLPRRSLMMRAIRAMEDEIEKWYDPADEEDEMPEPPMTSRQRVRLLTHLEWREAAAIVQAHGDPRPRVNPLASNRQESR